MLTIFSPYKTSHTFLLKSRDCIQMQKRISFSLIFLCILLCIPYASEIGWSWQLPYPQGTQIQDVYSFNNNKSIHVGIHGLIMITKDGGNSWEIKSDTVANRSSLFNIQFANEITGWISGSNGMVLKTEDGGDTWKKQNTGTSDYIQCV